MERVAQTSDDYLEGLAEGSGDYLRRLDALIRAAMPGRSRVLWRGTFWGGSEQAIVGYGDLVQSRPRGPDVEWFVVGLARQKSTLSIYVNAVDDGAYLVKQYDGRLGRATIGSAVISFRRAEDLDPDALSELVRRAGELHPANPG